MSGAHPQDGTVIPPSPRVLIERLGLERPVIGFYDTPDVAACQPCEAARPQTCLFALYEYWVNGRTIAFDAERCGCPGAARWLFGVQGMPDDQLARRLVDVEGIKEDDAWMAASLKSEPRGVVRNRYALIGPLRDHQWPFLRGVTFFVNPDQLTALVMGSEYHRGPSGEPRILVPSGPGCAKLMPFANPDLPQAAIGATDIGMRKYLPHDVLAFTVTRSMFVRLCRLDERSFLFKADMEQLRSSREPVARPGTIEPGEDHR